jgi:hypothetical protein
VYAKPGGLQVADRVVNGGDLVIEIDVISMAVRVAEPIADAVPILGAWSTPVIASSRTCFRISTASSPFTV